jgi:hypothetical protein
MPGNEISSSASDLLQTLTQNFPTIYTVKRLAIFTSPAGISLTKLAKAGNNLIIPGQGEYGE